MGRTGTTKRRPSAAATSPPPHAWATGMVVWVSTRQALARPRVSARRAFGWTPLSRLARRAGISARTTGSSPMLQASASRTAQRLSGRSATRAAPALRGGNSGRTRCVHGCRGAPRADPPVEPGEHVVPPCDQAGRLVKRLESRARQRVTTLDLFYPDRGMGGDVGGGAWGSGVEWWRQGVEGRRRPCAPAQGTTDLGPQRLPRWAVQQVDAWITPAFTASDPHVAASPTVWPAFHQTQGRRAPVGHGWATWEDTPAPGTGDQVSWGVRPVRVVWRCERPANGHRREQGWAGRRAVTRHRAAEGGSTAPSTAIAVDECRGIVIVGGTGPPSIWGQPCHGVSTRRGPIPGSSTEPSRRRGSHARALTPMVRLASRRGQAAAQAGRLTRVGARRSRSQGLTRAPSGTGTSAASRACGRRWDAVPAAARAERPRGRGGWPRGGPARSPRGVTRGAPPAGRSPSRRGRWGAPR